MLRPIPSLAGELATESSARLAPLLAAVLLTTLELAAPAYAVEESAYTVLEKDGAFELRQYPAILVAETLVPGANFDDAGGIAFNRLFQYITGNNRGNREIAMTSPVVQTADQDGVKIAMTSPVIQRPDDSGGAGYRVAFSIPAEYTPESVPEPLDPDVRIVAIPARLMVARRYSGWTSQELHDRNEQTLRIELTARKLVAVGEPITAQYDAPFIPGPFRRNEVLIPVRRVAAAP